MYHDGIKKNTQVSDYYAENCCLVAIQSQKTLQYHFKSTDQNHCAHQIALGTKGLKATLQTSGNIVCSPQRKQTHRAADKTPPLHSPAQHILLYKYVLLLPPELMT